MANSAAPVSFDDIIQEGRRKKKAEKLAQEIFGKKGRASAPPTGPRNALGASLASRVGVQKRTPSIPRAPTPRQNARNALHSRPAPDTQRPHLVHSKSANNALDKARDQRSQQVQVNPKDAPQKELSIKGAAKGPYTVMAQNFAPGTTGADIESVMYNVGGEMTDCRIVAAAPTVIAEMTFVEKSGAQDVIDTFNGKQADGRALFVYWKHDGGAVSNQFGRREATRGGAAERTAPAPAQAPETDDEVMEIDENAEAREAENRLREERRAHDARDARNDRDDRDARDGAQRDVFPIEPRGYRGAQMDRYDDRRMDRPQPRQAYQDRRYGFGRGGYGYGYRGAPRGMYDDRRFGGQGWR